MQESLLPLLRCPVTRSSLSLQVISKTVKTFNQVDVEVVNEGLLISKEGFVFPVIGGIPRLIVEAFLDYEAFLRKHYLAFDACKISIKKNYGGVIQYAVKKNAHTKQSFRKQWGVFNYEKDRTWEADSTGMLQRFLKETDETAESIKGKLVFDPGCGNGLLNQLLAESGANILGMDLSTSVERAYYRNDNPNAFFIQGDLQFPPVDFTCFDIVHCSGVLHHTNNTELSFSCIEPCVKANGKLSVWLYKPRKDVIHNLFNTIRKLTSRLPVNFQYYLYKFTIFPVSYVIKRIKGNRQNTREMMISILDWFSPEFRWEHRIEEAESWYKKRGYKNVKVTTTDIFGFNMTGIKATTRGTSA